VGLPQDWDQFILKSRGNSGNERAFCGYPAEVGYVFMSMLLATTTLPSDATLPWQYYMNMKMEHLKLSQNYIQQHMSRHQSFW